MRQKFLENEHINKLCLSPGNNKIVYVTNIGEGGNNVQKKVYYDYLKGNVQHGGLEFNQNYENKYYFYT